MDNQTLFGGPDKRVAPRGGIGGARSSCPMNRDGLSKVGGRTRQAGPSEKRT